MCCHLFVFYACGLHILLFDRECIKVMAALFWFSISVQGILKYSIIISCFVYVALCDIVVVFCNFMFHICIMFGKLRYYILVFI